MDGQLRIDNLDWTAIAQQQVRAWVLSGDPMEGEDWVMWCELAGVDPEVFARMAQAKLDEMPRHPCGHPNNDDNTYLGKGGHPRCRMCVAQRRAA